jgi:hypothetical protein
VVSVTGYQQVSSWGLTRKELEEHHAFFQEDDQYIHKLLRLATNSVRA